MNKKGFEISFAWMFSLIIGAIVLFLAIFIVIKLNSTGDFERKAIVGSEILVLTNPLETGIESGRATVMSISGENRLYNLCSINGEFGSQGIGVTQKSFGKWTRLEDSVPSSMNKYFFFENPVEGRDFVLFSEPFNFPFKVADLIYIIPTNKKYCFTDAPEAVRNKVESTIQPVKVIFTENCTREMTEVCFIGNCNISVDYNNKKITKNGKESYFIGDSLMFAGIFSDSESYECQVRRLMKRVDKLTLIYVDKSRILSQRQCYTGLDSELLQLYALTGEVRSSEDLRRINPLVEDIQRKSSGVCRLW